MNQGEGGDCCPRDPQKLQQQENDNKGGVERTRDRLMEDKEKRERLIETSFFLSKTLFN